MFDDAYAAAAAEAQQDQLDVQALDRSIDAGERDHSEVYDDKGSIHQHLLGDDEPTQEHTAPDIGFDEPF